jgi:hypothetical protein
MTNIYALIIGIEKYNEGGWNVSGPAAGATQVAEWCRSIGVPASHLHLFLSVNDSDSRWAEDRKSEIDDLERDGVTISKNTSQSEIATFWRQNLRKLGAPDSKLLVYWCGHGMASSDRDRILFHTDYNHDSLTDRVTSVDNLLATLATGNYLNFREQLILTDVCGDFKTLRANPNKPMPDIPVSDNVIKQHLYLASLDGASASIKGKVGHFTAFTLDVLKEFKSWPCLDALWDNMERERQKVTGNDFTILIRTPRINIEYVGRDQPVPLEEGGQGGYHRTFEDLIKDAALPELLTKARMFNTVTSRHTVLESIGINADTFVYPDELPAQFIQRLLLALQKKGLLVETCELLSLLPMYDVRPDNFPELGGLMKSCNRLLDERRKDRSRSNFPRIDN